jgi:NADH-quinone oxidoreductase subunit N
VSDVVTIPVNLSAIAPEIILLGCAAALMLFGVFLNGITARVFCAVVTIGGFVGAMIAVAAQWDDRGHWSFAHTLRVDDFGRGAGLIVFSAGLLATLVGWGTPWMRNRAVEYHTLLLIGAGGMSLLAISNSFVTVFVALELLSICLYILVAMDVDTLSSLEGGLKYLIVGAVGAALLLYGAALVYGATGAFEFDRIAAGARGRGDDALLLGGLALVIVGLAFKANAAPLHMWTPDAYEGAPTPVTTFMSAATKVAALVVIMRVLVTAFPGQHDIWKNALAGLAIASFAIGNLAALRQTNVKRMLAYSTVGHTGFLLTAVAAGGALGARSLLFYLVVYAVTNVGAFTIVAIREREIGRPVEIRDFAGYAYTRPVLSIAMTIFMLSLAGIPPTAGFLAKLGIFSAAVQSDLTYLAVCGVIATMVALVYYLRVPLAVIDREARLPIAEARPGFAPAGLTAVLSAVAVIILFVVPGPVLDLAKTAGTSLFGG